MWGHHEELLITNADAPIVFTVKDFDRIKIAGRKQRLGSYAIEGILISCCYRRLLVVVVVVVVVAVAKLVVVVVAVVFANLIYYSYMLCCPTLCFLS